MLTGVILAGGFNRRMGGQLKALLPFPKRPILELQIEEMQMLCDEILIISNHADLIRHIVGNRARVIPDIHPGLGPLGGLYTALQACADGTLWLVACDMPYISSEAAAFMKRRLEEVDGAAIVPVESGLIHPLHALYSTECKSAVESMLNDGRLSMMELLSSVTRIEMEKEEFVRLGMDFRFTANINTPGEYESALPPTRTDGRFVRETLTVREGQNKLIPFIRKLETEEIHLLDSLNRVTAEDVYAPHPMPHYRRSGYDGYAIRSVDSHGARPDAPVTLRILETIACGDMPEKQLTAGSASRIMTGAAVPDGADAVIMLEMTEDIETAEGKLVRIKKQMNAGSNIAEIGQEMTAGTLLIPAGRRVQAGISAVLAGIGKTSIAVYRKPVIAIFATGSELLEPSEPLQNGKIRNSNSTMLAALVRESGGVAVIKPVLRDDNVEDVMKAVTEAMEQYDAVITTGGVSVGDYDVLADLFDRWDGTLLFNKIAMRPGSPTSVGVRGGKLLFALSGNPGAAFVGFQLFARPVIEGMLGNSNPIPQKQMARLNASIDKPSPYPRYVRGRVFPDHGQLAVEPVGPDKSSIMVSLIDATCLIVIPAGGRGSQQGEMVEYIPI